MRVSENIYPMIEKYIIGFESTLFQTLQEMNDRKIKFAVVVDVSGKVIGTLTDGDVRRAVLRGVGLDSESGVAACKDFTCVDCTAGLNQVLEAFQDTHIEFLPVLDNDKRLCNLITRRALNVMLLQNERFQINYDFCSIDENALEHEIYARPWGFYKTTVLNDMFQSKIIYVMPNQALSLQSHNHREEYWIIINGEGRIRLEESEHAVSPGQSYFIPKGCKHRLTNTSDKETLILTEVQLGDYFGEDDIYRYEDRYNRN